MTTAPVHTLMQYSRSSTDFVVRVLRGFAWPKVDLLIRLWLAGIFFASGVLKLSGWQTALYLSAHEYPVGFGERGLRGCGNRSAGRSAAGVGPDDALCRRADAHSDAGHSVRLQALR